MNMKKIGALLCVLAIAASFSACGGADSDAAVNDVTESVPAEEETATTEAVLEPVTLTADDFEYTYDAALGGLVITDCSYDGNAPVIIPSEIDGDAVVSIGDGAFRGSALTGISLPDSLISIGENAFSSTGLTEITFPDSVTSLGKQSFAKCKSLEEITFGKGLEGIGASFNSDWQEWEYVGSSVFEQCTSLKSIVIPKEMKCIGGGAFADCVNLESFICEGNGLDGYTLTIGGGAFANCGFKSLTITANMEVVGNMTFYNCKSLTDVVIEDGIESIAPWEFYGCEALKNVTLPDSITNIDVNAFAGCTALREELNIPDNAEIERGAFYNCNALTVIYKGEEYNYANDPNGWWKERR